METQGNAHLSAARSRTGAHSWKIFLAAGACAAAVAAAAPAAFAQEADAATPDRVTVTGSRIQRDGMQSPTPVTVMSAAELEQMAPTTLMDALVQMPQFAANSTAENGNIYGEGSQSVLNLRGIGSNRTLILLDGRRVVGSTRNGTTDVSLFPEALVERVDVVTGGASAAYGSDAVSGVVNFILDTDYEGLKGHAQAGITEEGDNQNFELSLSGGMPVGAKGHLLLSAEHYEAEGIRGYGSRDWFESWGTMMNPDPNGPTRITRKGIGSRHQTYGGVIPTGPLAGTQFVEGGHAVPFDSGELVSRDGQLQVGGSAIDPNRDYAWLYPDLERTSGFAHFKWDFSENFSAYANVLAGRAFSGEGLYPEGHVGPWQMTIYADNAFLPTELRNHMLAEGIQSFPFGRSPFELEEGRYYTNENEMISTSVGFEGELPNAWRYQAYYQYGRNVQTRNYGNGRVLRNDRIYRALDAVVDPASGDIVCRSTLSTPDDGCVPLNLFGAGSVSEEAKRYIRADSYYKQETDQHFIEGAVDGELFEGWAGPVSLALGASYRKDETFQRAYPLDLVALEVASGPELTWRGQPPVTVGATDIFNRGNPNSDGVPIQGSFKVWEMFGETLVPVVQDAPFAESLDVSLAVRYADYSGSGGIWAYKGGVDWQLFQDLRLRGTYSRDVRAGTLSERFDSTGGGANVDDPTLPGEPTYLTTVIAGGNPNVAPEKADTMVIGGVYQPAWFDGFAVSVDYYDIKIKDAIDQLGTQVIVDECFRGAVELCAQIDRSEIDGRIDAVRDVFLNVAQARTRGVDVEMSYTTPFDMFGSGGSLSFRAFANYLAEDSITNFGAPKFDTAGQVAAGESAPEWTGNLSATYSRGPLTLFLQERYIGSGIYNITWVEGVDIDDNHVGEAWYTNARVSYDFERPNGGVVTAFLNVTNLFNADPPRAASGSYLTGTTHTNYGLYDVLGRRFVGGVRFEF